VSEYYSCHVRLIYNRNVYYYLECLLMYFHSQYWWSFQFFFKCNDSTGLWQFE